MKKKLAVLFSLLFALSVLCACGGGDNGGGEKPKAPAGAIYGEGIETYLVSNIQYGEFEYDSLYDVYNALSIRSEGDIYYVTDAADKADHEIVVGDTKREVSKEAKEYLEKRIKREARKAKDEDYALSDLVGYAIYSDGSSVAIVWTDFHAAPVALEFFTKNYIEITKELALEDGYIKSDVFSLDAYLTERADKLMTEYWAEYEKYAGADITAAMKNLYTLYKPEMVTWFANLYDPAIGGFYWSNSARDNEGYLPSIEETYEALSFVENSGMAEMFGGKWENAVPEWLKEQVGGFIYELQDKDGFYYHPQWPKEYIEANGLQSRITRDKGSATTVLKRLGIKPKYASYESDVHLPGRFGDSSAVAVSKVVSTAGMLGQYESVEAFREYLDGFESELAGSKQWANKFYSWGNLFQSTTSYLTPEMRVMLTEFFDKYQDPTTGMWMHSSENLVAVNPTNGLHKIGAVYNSIGSELKHVDEMVNSVFRILSVTTNEQPMGCTAIYNAWSCFSYIFNNIRKCGEGTDIEKQLRCQEIKDRVYAEAPRLIGITFEQVSGLLMPDGSFLLMHGGGSHTGQGCPVSVPGVLEGNVNGTGIAHYALIHHIDAALELERYSVPTFTEKERVLFVKTLEGLSPVVKNEPILESEFVYTFDEVEVGTVPEEIGVKLGTGYILTEGAAVYVDEHEDGNKVLQIDSRPRTIDSGRNYQTIIPVRKTSASANVSILETKLFISSKSTASPSLIEVLFQSARGMTIVVYPRIGLSSSKIVSMYDSNRNKICDIGKADTVINLRIEYYPFEGVYKIYSDDVFKGMSTDTYNFVEHALLGSVSFCSPSGMYGDVWMDDINFRSTVKEYVDPSADMESVRPATYETFEGKYEEVEAGLSYNDGSTTISGKVNNLVFDTGTVIEYSGSTNRHGATAQVVTDSASGNKYVNITSPERVHNEDRSHSITLTPEQCAFEPNAYVLDLDLKLDKKTADGTPSTANFLQLIVYGTNKKHIQYSMINGADDSVSFGGVNACNFDEWTSLRFVFDTSADVIDLYAKNGEGKYELLGRLGNATQAADQENKNISIIGDEIATVSISGSHAFSMNIDNIAFYSTVIEGYED